MLYKYDKNLKNLIPEPYYNYADLKGLEKDLENLLANHLSELYIEDSQLMPIFQERAWQEEPDLCALDKNGNLTIFELKRGTVPGDTTIQVMRYAQQYGQYHYEDLNNLYQRYITNKVPARTAAALAQDHMDTFGLEKPLHEEEFNTRQHLVIVGNSSDSALMDAVEYWKSKGIDIDFLPYRFYKIGAEVYFEFFAKPYDFHLNPRNIKGILFDTNRSYDPDAIWDMFAKSKISAYGGAATLVNSFNKDDYVLYYHKGYGVVGAGVIKSGHTYEDSAKDELYRKVDLLTPVLHNESDIKAISPKELSALLGGKNFYLANTTKRPYLSAAESKIIVEELKERYK